MCQDLYSVVSIVFFAEHLTLFLFVVWRHFVNVEFEDLSLILSGLMCNYHKLGRASSLL